MKHARDNKVAQQCQASLPVAKASLSPCFSSQSAEWNTPHHIIKPVLKILRTVDLDPCSNSMTFPNIPAEKHYTRAENGLTKTWEGRVYMNPPYGREIIDWVKKLHSEYRANHVVEAVALLPARTDTAWFRLLRDYPKCFIHGRLRFGDAVHSAPFPSVIVYFGRKRARFQQVFSDLGDVYIRL